MPPSDSPRIAELRRRVHADPASIAFAQLAEEYRRAGHYEEAVKYCRGGLARHPGYLSARVTLGRALSELGGLDEAAREFALVLTSAPDNLAAIRGLAEIHHRRGEMAKALELYQRALSLARFDSELEETVDRIGREMGAVGASAETESRSFEHVASDPFSAAHAASEAPPSPHTTAAPVPRATRPDLIDFDAVLASLGVPDASPPPMMEMLLSTRPVASPRPEPVLPPPPASGLAAQAFADLERELRAFDGAVAAPSPDPTVRQVLDELESWMRVLQSEQRTAQG